MWFADSYNVIARLPSIGLATEDRGPRMKASRQAATKEQVDLIPLCRLRAGEGGCVGDVLGTCDMVHRLREMGLYDGARIQMIRPGSPCIIRLQGQRLGFRMDDCAHVMVRLNAVAS